MKLSRRDLLSTLTGVLCGLVALPRRLFGGSPPKPRPAFAGQLEALANETRQPLQAAIERLLPGANEAGVPQFMDHWLAKDGLASAKRLIERGALALDASARTAFQGSFASLSGEQQDTILTQFAGGKVKQGGLDGVAFFKALLELTVEGFLSHPQYGGNLDRVGWKLIGVPDGLGSCWWNPKGVDVVLRPGRGLAE